MAQRNEPWAIGEKDYPFGASAHEQLRFMLGYAILAPSTHNTQPWLFELHERGVDLYADPTRALNVIDPTGRQLHMSCGAALYNLRVAMRYFGHDTHLELLPPGDADLLARLRIRGVCRPSPLVRELFRAIPRRRTNRQAFADHPVSLGFAEELATLAAREGAWLARLHPRHKGPLAEVITAADRAQFKDRRFRKELADWLVPFGSRRKDGIPFVKKEYGSALPLSVTLRVRTFDLGAEVGAKEEALARGSPALLVLGTKRDDRAGWMAAGQAMQAVLLRAASHGLSASFLNQALEVDELRRRVRDLVGGETHPQLVLRMGFGPEVEQPTPRRPLEEVVSLAEETRILAARAR